MIEDQKGACRKCIFRKELQNEWYCRLQDKVIYDMPVKCEIGEQEELK